MKFFNIFIRFVSLLEVYGFFVIIVIILIGGGVVCWGEFVIDFLR